jgi:hypothetical protein
MGTDGIGRNTHIEMVRVTAEGPRSALPEAEPESSLATSVDRNACSI